MLIVSGKHGLITDGEVKKVGIYQLIYNNYYYDLSHVSWEIPYLSVKTQWVVMK